MAHQYGLQTCPQYSNTRQPGHTTPDCCNDTAVATAAMATHRHIGQGDRCQACGCCQPSALLPQQHTARSTRVLSWRVQYNCRHLITGCKQGRGHVPYLIFRSYSGAQHMKLHTAQCSSRYPLPHLPWAVRITTVHRNKDHTGP